MSSKRRVFLKQLGASTLGASLLCHFPHDTLAKGDKTFLPRSTPESQGLSSAQIEVFLDAVEKSKIEFHSLMILRHGHVVAEGWWAPYQATLRHKLYSLSKSFTSTAVGLAIGEGLFTADTPVTTIFPKELPPEVSSKLAAMQVKHLLTMTTGHAKDTLSVMRESKDTWIKTFLSLPPEHEPGTFFLYNTGATYMLSAIVQRLTGQTLHDFLRPRLFQPLGIVGEDWEKSPQGVTVGGYGLRIKTEDIAKLGQLYLQRGKWGEKVLVDPNWVDAATSKQVESSPSVVKRPPQEDDWAQGYGYQFWRCRPGGFRADGAFGQFSIVLPEKDMVVAITGESFDMQQSMNLVWEHLLPATDQTASGDHTKAQKSLSKRLNTLGWPAPVLESNSIAESVIMDKLFGMTTNAHQIKTITFSFSPNACDFIVTDPHGTHTIRCGINRWKEQRDKSPVLPLFPVAGRIDVSSPLVGSVTWNDEKTMVMTLRYLEDTHSDTITFVFEDNTITLKFMNSISQHNTGSPELRADVKGILI